MAQKELWKLYPKIEGDANFGFGKLSFIPTDTEPANAVEGMVYYDNSENKLKVYNGSSWEALDSDGGAAGTGLDGNYDINDTITVDAGAVTLAANGVGALALTQATNHVPLTITKAATGAGALIDLANSGTGYDIDGTSSTWYITKAGVATFGNVVGNDLTLTDSTVLITTDLTDGVAATLNVDTLTSGYGLRIDMDTASTATLFDILVGAAHVVTIDDTGLLTLLGVAKDTDALIITDGDITVTDGDIDITSGQFSMTTDGAGDGMTLTDLAAQNNDLLYLNGTTCAGSGSIFKIDQGAAARTGHMVDLNMGATAVAMSAIDISCTGGTRTEPIIGIDSDATASDFIEMQNSVVFTGNFIEMIQDTSAATGNFIFINNDSGTSMEAINIDDEANTQDIIYINTAAATADNKALINLVASGTPAAAGSNMLRVDGSGMTATNKPVLVEIIGAGKTVRGLEIDCDIVDNHVALIHGGGALTNGKAVLALTNDGNLAAGGNLLNVTMGGTPADATACAVEIVASKDCLALDITSSAATDSSVQVTNNGAIANDKAILELVGTGTPANTGSNLLRVDGSGLTATNKPTLVEVVGAGKDVIGMAIDADSVGNVVTINGGGNIADNTAVLKVSADGATQTAGGVGLLVTNTGTPNAGSIGIEGVFTGKDMIAMSIDVDNATNHGVLISGTGVIGDNKAALCVTNDAAIAAGSSLVRIESSANSAGATAYGLEIACNGSNLEGLLVSAGTVSIAETLTVTGQITAPAGVQGILGTAANLTDTTPTSAEFDTAFGSGNKTKGGFIGVVEDSGSGVAYLVFSDGTTWHFCTGTGAAT